MDATLWKRDQSKKMQTQPEGMEVSQTLPDTPLTFGVELEFIVATLPIHAVDPSPSYDSWPIHGITGEEPHLSDAAFENVQKHIATTLSAHGYEAQQAFCNRSLAETFSHWIIDYDSTLAAPNKEYEYYGLN